MTVSTVELPKAAVTALAEGAEKTIIKTNVGNITVPAAALSQVLTSVEESSDPIVFRCENTTDEAGSTKETFNVGFYPAGSADPDDELHISQQNITLTLMTSFAAGTNVKVTSEGQTLAAPEVAAGGAVSFTITHLSEIEIESTEDDETPDEMAMHIKTEAVNDALYPAGTMKVTVTGGEAFTDLSGYSARIQISDLTAKAAQVITVLPGTENGFVFGVDTTGKHCVDVALYQDGKLVATDIARWNVSVGMDETFGAGSQD